MLGEDDISVCIPTTTHPFDSILGSTESQYPVHSPDSLFMTIWLLIIYLPVESWFKQFGSVVPKLYTIHQIPLFWRRGCQILLWSFSLFAHYSWQQYSLKATLSTFDLSFGSGWIHLHISGGTYSNLLTCDSTSSYLPTLSTIALTILCASDGLELCSLLSQDYYHHPSCVSGHGYR